MYLYLSLQHQFMFVSSASHVLICSTVQWVNGSLALSSPHRVSSEYFPLPCCALCLFWQYSKLNNSAYLLFSWVASLAGISGSLASSNMYVQAHACVCPCSPGCEIKLHLFALLLLLTLLDFTSPSPAPSTASSAAPSSACLRLTAGISETERQRESV